MLVKEGWSMNIFTKFTALLLLLLIPTGLLYGYSNHVSVQVIETELQKSSLSSLIRLQTQIDSIAEQISLSSMLLLGDPSIRDIRFYSFYNDTLELNNAKKQITEKLAIQAVSSSWVHDITVYGERGIFLASTNRSLLAAELLSDNVSSKWEYISSPQPQFQRRFRAGIQAEAPSRATIDVEVPIQQLIKTLDEMKLGTPGDPFLFHPQHGYIANSSADPIRLRELITKLSTKEFLQGNQTIQLDHTSYLVNFSISKQLGWYVVDYVPLDKVLSPVNVSRTLFYACSVLLLLLGIAAAFLLYRNVQVPLSLLMRSMQRVKIGDYSTRLGPRKDKEFRFVFSRFNEMTQQIQTLIESVYEAKLRARESELKQLQSQINPHFLYNCLNYVKHMARLGDEESVVRMAVNLADYYRYATRVEKQKVMVKEELKLVRSYLEIQQMRLKRMSFLIEVPEHVSDRSIPRLLIQPIVENAVIHGIEQIGREGLIRITGGDEKERIYVQVEDNGPGMEEDALSTLRGKLEKPLDEEMGCGLWNVHQRLRLTFGEQAGLEIRSKPGEGTIIRLWLH